MKHKKVAHILHSVGGVDVHLRIILKAINPANIETIIIHGEDDTAVTFKNKNNVPVNVFKIPIQREISIYKDVKAVLKAIRILRKEKPDVIHAHSAKGGIIARAASIFYPVTVLYTPHAFSYLSTPNSLKRKFYLVIEKVFKHFNSVLLACSISEKNRGINDVGYKNHKTVVFNNSIYPIESEKENVIDNLTLPKKYICTVGRPSYQKNIEMMVEVIKEIKKNIPNIHLVLMGVGVYSPNKENVINLIEKYDLQDNITLIPWIERTKIFSIVKNAQLYISTARYEGLPYSVIEALALGKACVVTDCDGNRDLIEENYNGFVIKDNSVERMANRIFVLLNDEQLRFRFEKNAKQHFNEHFNIENNIEKLEKIYTDFSKK